MTKTLPFLYDYCFANMILPNAATSEMAMVNILFSKYNPGFHYHSLFDKEKGSHTSALKKIFGNHYMDWAPVMRDNGPHLTNQCYHPFVNIVEDSVIFGKRKYEKYIYPILLGPHSRLFLGIGQPGDKIQGEYFWKNISADVLEDVRFGKAVILLDWAHECLMTRDLYVQFHKILEGSGIPPRHIIFAHNSFNAVELYEKWFEPQERRLTVMDWPFLMFMISHHFYTNPSYRLNLANFLKSKNTKREFYFLFKNRRAHTHRCAMTYLLYKENLLDRADWSMLEKLEYERFAANVHYHGVTVDPDTCRSLYQHFPKQMSTEDTAEFSNVHGWTDTNPGTSGLAYFEITTETLFTTPYRSTTEKICKPLVNFLPFLVIGPPGILRQLRDLGYKTFAPLIDESYDEEEDHNLRLAKIAQEAKRLCEMNKDQLHDWYWSMEDILIHNHNKILEFHKHDPINIRLIDHLHNLIQ
jgi:hypothetical protein